MVGHTKLSISMGDLTQHDAPTAIHLIAMTTIYSIYHTFFCSSFSLKSFILGYGWDLLIIYVNKKLTTYRIRLVESEENPADIVSVSIITRLLTIS